MAPNASIRRLLLFLCEGLVGVESCESPQSPDGEDVSIGVVVNGAGLVEHPCDILLRQKHLGVEKEEVQDRVAWSNIDPT